MKYIFRALLLSIMIVSVIGPLYVGAVRDISTIPEPGDTGSIPDPGDTGTIPDRGETGEIPDLNPTRFTNICDLINEIIKVVAQLGSLVGILFIIWSGFLFVKAQGNPEELGRAKRTFYTTIIGLAILLGASAITSIIFNTVSSITTAGGATSICPASEGSGSYESAGGSF